MRKCFCIRRPIVGRGITATIPAGVTAADPDHAAEREQSEPCLGLSDRPDRADQIFAAAGGWHFVLHRSGQYLGGRCALRPPDLALHLSAEQGEHIGHRGVAMYKGYLYFLTPDAHLVSLNAKDGTVRWNVEVADVTKGYWTTHGAAGRGQPRDRWRVRRFRQPERLYPVDRSGDRRDAMAVEFHSSGRNSERRPPAA